MTLITSNNLGLVQLVNGQTNPETTANDKGGELDSFLTAVQSISVSSGNQTVGAADYLRYRKFKVTGNTTVGRSLTLRAVSRAVIVDNSDAGNTQSLAIKLGTTTINLAAGKKAMVETDGTANGLELIVTNDFTLGGLGTISTFNEATAAQYLNNTPGKALSTDKIWSAAGTVTLTDASTVTMDFSTFINAKLTGTGGVGSSRTLGAAANAKVGQSGILEWFPVTGALTLVIPSGSSYVAAGGIAGLSLSNTNGARDAITYSVLNDGKVLLAVHKALAT